MTETGLPDETVEETEAPKGKDPFWRDRVEALKKRIGQIALLRVALTVGDKRNGVNIPVEVIGVEYKFGNVRAVVRTAFEPRQEFSVDAERLDFGFDMDES